MRSPRSVGDFLTRQWAEHREPGVLEVHTIGAAFASLSITLLLAKAHVTLPAALPLVGGSAVSLGWIYAIAIVLWTLPLDGVAAATTAALLALGTGAIRGHMFGEWATDPGALAVAALGLVPAALLPRVAHRVYYDVRHEHLPSPWSARARNALASAIVGFPVFCLLLSLTRGRRPELRAELEARSRRLFQPEERRPWRNWAGTQTCRPAVVWYPESAEDLVEIVNVARREKRRIRVVGAAYSWAPLVPTDQVLICLCLMNEVRLELADPSRPRAVVGAGATGRDVNRALEPAGYAVTSNVVMETVSWGGMVGVGAHGSGRCEPTLSDMVERVELVDGTGAIRCFELGKDANEVMNAVRVSLGLFGVVFRVTIRVVTAFDVLHEDRFLTVDETLRQLPDLVQGNEYLDLYWMPFTERVWVRIWNRTDSPRVRRLPQGPWTGFSDRNHWGLWMTWLQTVALVPLDWLTRLAPRLTPSVCRMKMAMAAPGSRVVHINQATHFRSAIESYRVGCVEIAFEVDPAFDAVKRSWASVTREIEAWAERGSYPLHMVVNARFIGGSDCFLSPARGNALTAYIEILGNHRHPEWTAFASAVGREWLKLPKARPHWGKEYDFIPGIEAHVRAALGDDLRRFLRVRDELGVDPDRLFVNPFLDRLLGAGAAPAGERRPPT